MQDVMVKLNSNCNELRKIDFLNKALENFES